MESLFQLFDEVEDYIVATAIRLRRSLTRRPRERRRVCRTSPATSERRHSLLAGSKH